MSEGAAEETRQEDLKGPEAFERVREYLDLQMLLAEKIAEKTGSAITETVLQYTNYHRRFGFGSSRRQGPNPRWEEYVNGLAQCKDHAERMRWTGKFYASTPKFKFERPERVFGCFNFDIDEDTGLVHIHFNNLDPLGSLKKERAHMRCTELKEMFAFIRKNFADKAKNVEGGSWLYGLSAYRRLFPPEYADSATVKINDFRFQGTSRWGQLLNAQGGIKADLREKFLRNLENLDISKPWEVFPLPTYEAHAPIQIFYDYDFDKPAES